jgi:hypothetical protein
MKLMFTRSDDLETRNGIFLGYAESRMFLLCYDATDELPYVNNQDLHQEMKF